jgi:signal transduction histidine kinase
MNMTRQKKQEEPVSALGTQHSEPNLSRLVTSAPSTFEGRARGNNPQLAPQRHPRTQQRHQHGLRVADLLQSEPSISKTLKEDLKAIERAGLRARELLGALRSLASGVPAQLQLAPVDLKEICEQACSLMAAAFRRNYIQLVTDFSKETPIIISDASRLRFVFLACFKMRVTQLR